MHECLVRSRFGVPLFHTSIVCCHNTLCNIFENVHIQLRFALTESKINFLSIQEKMRSVFSP